MSLLEANPVYKPFRYPWAYDAWLTQQRLHWLPEEVPMAEDVRDWKQKLTPAEKNLLTQIFRFFTQADVEVNNCYMQHYARVFKPTEVLMMLVIGQWWPRINGPCVQPKAAVDLTPWAYAQPCAFPLLSCVVALYVVFSPIGLVGDGSALFAPVLLGLAAINMLMWLWWHRRLNAGVGAQQ